MSIYRTLKGYNIKSVTSDPANTKEGQIWYNDTSNKIRVNTIKPAAWASGGNLNTARFAMNQGAGTQTAGLVAGGNPSNSTLAVAEEYNGSSWAEQNDLNTSRQMMGAAGTQTASVFFGGRLIPPPSAKNETEEYNGTSFSEQNNLGTARYSGGGAGTQTAGLFFSGAVGGSTSVDTEEYNGTSWSEQNDMNVERRTMSGTAGTQTAALYFGGYRDITPTPNGAMNSTESYNGTSWTAEPALNTAVWQNTGDGIQTAAVSVGGPPTQTEHYDGSSWTTNAAINTVKIAAAAAGTTSNILVYGGTTDGGDTGLTATTELYNGTSWSEVADLGTARRGLGKGGDYNSAVAMGGLGPAKSNTEEWNITTSTITGAAWASGGNMNTARVENCGVSGTIPAAVAFGGYNPAASPKATANSEEYNGTSWTEGNNLGTARWDISGAGTQTAALVAGGGTPGSTANCEEYNGTSWAEQNNLNTQGRARTSGTQTAGMVSGRKDVPGITVNCETYDGTSWTEIANLNTARGAPQQVGDSSNALNASGTQDGVGGVVNVGNVESWDGSSWTEVANVLDDSRSGQGAGAYDNMMLLNGSGATANNTQMWNGTAWVTGTSTPYNATGGGANGPSSAVINSGGGDADGTIEFTAETTALNVENITDS